MTIHLITGSDPRLVSDKVTEITRGLIKSMNSQESRSTILETHDAGATSADLRENAIRQAVASAETMSLFGEERVVVIREISEATVGELSTLVKYLEHPSDSTHLVVALLANCQNQLVMRSNDLERRLLRLSLRSVAKNS